MKEFSYTAYAEQNKPTDFSSTLEGAGCCIIVDGKVLLLQRGFNNKFQAGTWGIPAGKLDAGETPEQAALRETLEETGISLTSDMIHSRGSIYITIEYEIPLSYRFYVYTVHLRTTPSVELEENQAAFTWVTHTEALRLPLFTGGREVLALGMTESRAE